MSHLFPLLGVAAVMATSGLAQATPSQRVLANTTYVEDLLPVSRTWQAPLLFAATRGGVEVFELPAGRRVAHYTTEHGLTELHVRKLSLERGAVIAHLSEARCVLPVGRAVDGSFLCTRVPRGPSAEMSVAGRLGGARITKKVRFGDMTLVATAGAGVWDRTGEPRRLTPTKQICSNHFMAIARFRRRTFFGSFDEGLCSTEDDQTFTTAKGPFRMINDLQVTPKGLYVAAAEGLFLTRDGTHFVRVPHVTQRGVNGLAYDGRSLWATTPGALWRIRVNGGPRDREYWMPGGSRSLQAVAARGKDVWIASEDRGLIRKTRRGFEIVDRAAGSPTSWFLDVAIAHDGTVYGATLRNDIVALRRDGSVATVGSPAGPWTLFVDTRGGDVLIGAQGGAAVLGRKQNTVIRPPHPNVHVIRKVGNATYIATEGGTLLAVR